MKSCGCKFFVAVSLLFMNYSLAMGAAEKPVTISDEQISQIIADAPSCPAIDGLGLSLKLIDFIDCCNAEDPHDFLDQGTSEIVTDEDNSLRYRQTAPHRHAFFAYRFKASTENRPIFIVFEYPDDNERLINFSTHESALTGHRNIDWSLETGVYTGNPFPLTNKYQYHSFVYWTKDKFPAAIVSNFHRGTQRAAASKIWVFEIQERLPELKLLSDIEPTAQRQLGHFNSMGWYLPTRLYFGYNSPAAVEHMIEYCKFVGINELAWTVVSGPDYGFDCTIPSWTDKPGHPNHLDIVLRTLDARSNIGFAAGFNFPASFKLPSGETLEQLDQDQLRKTMISGFDEFLSQYGKYKSLRKIIIGAQYNISLADFLARRGVLDDVIGYIRQKRPDIQVLTFLGGRQLHEEYFSGHNSTPTAGEVISGWEKSEKKFSDFLADSAKECWRQWSHSPKDLKKHAGLTIYEQYQSDDFGIFPLYAQQPRSMIYSDLDRSQSRSDAINTNFAAIWNTHYEGWFGLHEDVNFWYKKLWVAPDFNASGSFARAAFVRTLWHRDRLAIMPGSWNFKYFGHEKAMRRFAQAYRSLPPVIMDDINVPGSDSVKVRWAFYKKNRYVAIINNSPFGDSVHIDGKLIELKPFDLVTIVNEAKLDEPVVQGGKNIAYAQFIEAKVQNFKTQLQTFINNDPKADVAAYSKTIQRAEKNLNSDKIHTADIELADGLINELQLRNDILNPPVINVPHKDNAIYLGALVMRRASGSNIAGHLFFPNSWTGPDDFSCSYHLEHDNKNLLIMLKVCDKIASDADSVSIKFSTDDGYLDYTSDSRSNNIVLTKKAPLDGHSFEIADENGCNWKASRNERGYDFDIEIPLSLIGIKPGQSAGFLIQINDDDNQPNTFDASWAVKQSLIIPNKPNFAFWNDARNNAKLKIEPAR